MLSTRRARCNSQQNNNNKKAWKFPNYCCMSVSYNSWLTSVAALQQSCAERNKKGETPSVGRVWQRVPRFVTPYLPRFPVLPDAFFWYKKRRIDSGTFVVGNNFTLGFYDTTQEYIYEYNIIRSSSSPFVCLLGWSLGRLSLLCFTSTKYTTHGVECPIACGSWCYSQQVNKGYW